MRSFRAAFGLGLGLLLAAASSFANTYTVTSTADSGAGTLRQAVLDANANAGPDNIHFNIAGSGVHTITLASPLAALTSPVTIDGYTQSGASPNTQPFGQGLNTVLRIQVTGGAGVGTCFIVQASDTTIKGLVMNGCTTSVDIQSGSNNRVEGNFLGTDPAGTQRLVDSGGEVVVGNAPSAHVGGSTPAARNLITACGVAVHATGANNGAVIEGNVIGIAASGDVLLTPPCGSTTFPIVIDGPNGQVVRNVIAGGANGIFLQGSSGKVARGNLCRHGRDGHGGPGPLAERHGRLRDESRRRGQRSGRRQRPRGRRLLPGARPRRQRPRRPGQLHRHRRHRHARSGQSPHGHQRHRNGHHDRRNEPGRRQHDRVQRRNLWTAAASASAASRSESAATASSATRPSPNNGLGIDLSPGGNAGVTPNDPGDGDAGPNGLQNYPLLMSAGPALGEGAGTHIVGVLNSTPSTTFDIDFYANPACASRPQEYLEGQDYIGSTQVTTDGSGNATIDVTLRQRSRTARASGRPRPTPPATRPSFRRG